MLEVSGLTGTVSAELQNTPVLPAREASVFKGAGTSWWLVFGEGVTPPNSQLLPLVHPPEEELVLGRPR